MKSVGDDSKPPSLHPLHMMSSLCSNFPAQALVGRPCATSPVTCQLLKWRSQVLHSPHSFSFGLREGPIMRVVCACFADIH